MKLLHRIDCTGEYSAERFFSFCESKIIDSHCGKYREAAPEKFSRFGYRFEIENIKAPHLALIRYPDDKPRFMLVSDGTTYDCSTGILTGKAFPLSGQMKELKQIFWPRFTDMSICLLSWDKAEPAAASSIEIYEMSPEELSPLDIERPADGGRQLGIQYEDPCGIGASEGANNFDTWLERVITQAKATGQNLVKYPICWYHGPWFPGTSERADAFNSVVAPDRKQYIVWTDEPKDWPARMLERFDQERISFQGIFTLLRLSSLMKKMNTDLDAIKSGAPTINNMLWNNEVQAGTMDWTTVYNTLNYPAMENGDGSIHISEGQSYAYGEATQKDYPAGPIFNPLHPDVQKNIIRFFEETCRQYARFKSFTGISATMWAPSLLWFGSLRSGYDDFTVKEFEKETGIDIPIDDLDPSRFSKRYDFLTYHCRPAWIEWRCRRIHDFITAIRDAMNKIRPDLRLTIDLWSEPYVPLVRGCGEPQHQIHARTNLLDLYSEAGLDISLFADEDNIDFGLQLDGGGRDRTSNNTKASGFMFRDQDYLDKSVWNELQNHTQSGAFVFHCWHEAWGKHTWFKTDPKDKNLPAFASVYGQPGKPIRMHSEYSKDGFWWDSQSRITPAFPTAPHYMEHYAHALAEMDATRITAGGLFMDKSHNDELRNFAKAYCALPARKFETIGGKTDPVAVRALRFNGRYYCYLVNREYYPVEVRLDFAFKPKEWQDLSGTNDAFEKIALGSYELRVLVFDETTEISNFETEIPGYIKGSLEREFLCAESVLKQALTEKTAPAGTKKILEELDSAMGKRHWSALRHLLGSYQVKQCLKFDAELVHKETRHELASIC